MEFLPSCLLETSPCRLGIGDYRDILQICTIPYGKDCGRLADDCFMHAQMHHGQTLVAKVDTNVVHQEAAILGGKYSDPCTCSLWPALSCHGKIFSKG